MCQRGPTVTNGSGLACGQPWTRPADGHNVRYATSGRAVRPARSRRAGTLPPGYRDTAPSLSVPATRVRRPGWRDPRLAVGLVLVAAATVAGARLLATSDDTVAVWVTTIAGPGR